MRAQFLSQDMKRFLREHGAVESFATLAELLPQAAVFVVNEKREVLYWSRGAEQLLGFSAEEVLGMHCLKSNRCANCMSGCGIAEFGAVNDVPLVLYRSDGQPVALRKTGRAFRDEEGEFQGGIEILLPDRQAEPPKIPASPPNTVEFRGLLSRSSSMLRVFELVRNVAEADVTVLIRGDSGTGKELVARALHEESARKEGPFVAVNCAAFPSNLLESQLFGHVKGAFTGAVSSRQGLFEQADGGTLFLDEVAELSPELQAKLLRVLQERSFVPVGGTRPRTVDVRILSATHRSLRQMVEGQTFREDLLYRLRVVPIFLPSLAERREDIEPLVWHFIGERNERGPRVIHQLSPEAMRAFLDYPWPGNIRELQNVMDYAFAVGRGPELRLSDLPPEFHAVPEGQFPAPTGLQAPPQSLPEADRIRLALEQTQGHNGRAAELLGISRVTLWRKRKKYAI